MLKKLTPNLIVDNVNTTLDFYKNILGFEVVMTVPEEGQFNWGMVRSGNVEIMIQARDGRAQEIAILKEKESGGSLTLYIETDEVEDLYAKLQPNVTIIQDIHTTFYGMREFSIQDCNGFILTFAQMAFRWGEE